MKTILYVTLLLWSLAASAAVTSTTTYPTPPAQFDVLKDFTWIACLTGYTFGFVVPADSPIKSIKDLVDVKGVHTRHGSAIFEDNVAQADDVLGRLN